jgi:broad specificity phosphatase PhoE
MTDNPSTADFTCIDFLRHGECVGGEIFRGSGSDVALTDRGWQQMRDSVQGLACWDSIITSPLQRCQRFALEQSQQCSIPLTENNAWREIHFGDWEGRLRADIWQQSPDLVANYFKDPYQSTPHNGEPFAEVAERLRAAWDNLLIEHRNQHVLVVQHGGTVRILLALILGMPATAMNQFEVPYACLSRIKVFHHNDYGDFPMLVSHNAGSPSQ